MSLDRLAIGGSCGKEEKAENAGEDEIEAQTETACAQKAGREARAAVGGKGSPRTTNSHARARATMAAVARSRMACMSLGQT